jgi:hypothetical protein
MLRRSACVGSVLLCLLGGGAAADTVVGKGMVRFIVGDADAAHAEVLIKPRFNARHVVSLRFRNAGRPGSRVALTVDRAATPVYAAVLAQDQCGQENGVAVCTVTVPGRSNGADAIVKAFTGGRVVHVSVEGGGRMEMSGSGSLVGFMAAFKQATE